MSSSPTLSGADPHDVRRSPGSALVDAACDVAAIGSTDWLDVVVASRRDDRGDTVILELASVDGRPLPPFAPGSHVAVRCGSSARHYSLCGPLQERGSYRIGIKVQASGRGGSAWLAQHGVTGARLTMSAPRDRFPLVRGRDRYLFVSGGIGLTPVLPMLERLHLDGVRARLVHLCRSPQDLAFADDLRSLGAVHDVHIHIDSAAGCLYDLEAELARSDDCTEVYCCGPAPVMQAVRAFAQRHGRAERYHFEAFDAPPQYAAEADRAFVVELATSGRRVEVAANQSILDALRASGLRLESECEEGVCGTCSLRVVAGTPDHRDAYLTDDERAANDLIMACVSRSHSPLLVLDIHE